MIQQTPSNTADWFEQWFGSPYYHLLYNNRDEQEAHQFVETLMSFLTPPPQSKMLDIACGEGRFAKQLAELGYDVTGIDLSTTSIETAKEAENEHLHFLVQDMRFMFYTNYFDYSFNFFTSFGYFKYDRDNKLAAKAFAASLKKGGQLVIDYMNSAFVVKNMIHNGIVKRGDITFTITKKVEHNHIIKNIRFDDAEKQPRQFTERVAAFTLVDFIALFEDAGMELVHTFGDYKLNSFDEATSPRLIMVFKKQ